MRCAPAGTNRRVRNSIMFQRQIAAIIEAIKDGLRTPSMKAELLALETRKEEPSAEIKQVPAPLPRLHPKLAELYRELVERLHEELNRPELRAEAAQALRPSSRRCGRSRRMVGSRSNWPA